MKKFLIELKLLIVELRFLNINDKRILEMIAIKFMNILQNILKNILKIQNLFDVAYNINVDEFDDSTLTF